MKFQNYKNQPYKQLPKIIFPDFLFDKGALQIKYLYILLKNFHLYNYNEVYFLNQKKLDPMQQNFFLISCGRSTFFRQCFETLTSSSI